MTEFVAGARALRYCLRCSPRGFSVLGGGQKNSMPGYLRLPQWTSMSLSEDQPVIHGVVDAAFASLATFSAALFAIRSLDIETLGLYAFFYAAYRVAVVIPRQLVFVPAEIDSVAVDASARLGVLRQVSRLAVGPVLVSAVTVIGTAVLLAPRELESPIVPLVVTAVAASVTTPFQEYLRRAFHLAGLSQRAGLVSLANFVVTLGVMALAVATAVPVVWIPIGSLALAYALSGSLGALLASRAAPADWSKSLKVRDLATAARPLLFAGLAPIATGFLVALLVVRLAGLEALGSAEAARIVARPVFVLAAGIAAALRPRAMEAANRRNVLNARSVSRRYTLIVGSATLMYLGLVGFSGPWNPMEWLVPTAYLVPGLVALTVIAAGIDGVALPYRFQLLGAHREAAYAKVEAAGNLIRTLFGAASAVLKAYALPLGLLALGLSRLVGYQLNLRGLYETRSEPGLASVGSQVEPSPQSTDGGVA